MDAERRAGREVEGVKDRATEQPPAAVPEEAKQAGEIRARWAWVEPTVWTERMLAALEQGVKGGKWFSLMDKVYALPNLRAAFAKVRANAGAAGVDRQTVEMFEQHAEGRMRERVERLADGLNMLSEPFVGDDVSETLAATASYSFFDRLASTQTQSTQGQSYYQNLVLVGLNKQF
jgi:hypothetical protein